MNKTKTYRMVLTGLAAALLCIAGPVAVPIPISPVPISLTNFAICIAAFLLDWKCCGLSVVIYILLGAAGLPVFSGYMGGLQKLAGPTGGYIVGFIFSAMICAFFVEKFGCKTVTNVIGMVIGFLVDDLFGTVWFMLEQHTEFLESLALCVAPYLIGDGLKIAAAAVLGAAIRKAVWSKRADSICT